MPSCAIAGPAATAAARPRIANIVVLIFMTRPWLLLVLAVHTTTTCSVTTNRIKKGRPRPPRFPGLPGPDVRRSEPPDDTDGDQVCIRVIDLESFPLSAHA